MAALIWISLALPMLAAAAALWRPRAEWTRYAQTGTAVLELVCGVGLILAVRSGGPVVTAAGLLRVDALSGYLLTVVGAVAVTATWGGLRPRSAGRPPNGRYSALVCLFLAAMCLALLADNLGILWVAIEGTTIATAFLVGSRGGRRALEAAWKYVVLGSVGVAIAFLGLVLLYAATEAAGRPTLSWLALSDGSIALNPGLARTALALAVLGFATKAGLAPMHSWLPDAHSQAPAPVSGLMSGVLLSVAFYAILRIKTISDALLGPALMRGLLLAAGLLSLTVAAALILRQRDYKRMLAYSSIEHMGLLALGAAAGGPLALAAVLLHILGHGLTKASMFVVAGRVLSVEGSSKIADVHSLLARRPRLGVPFLAGMVALLGLPPFGLFFTELGIIIGGWQRGLGWAMAIALGLLLVVFAGLAHHTASMTLGGAPTAAVGAEREAPVGAVATSGEASPPQPGAAPEAAPASAAPVAAERALGSNVPIALALGITAVLGFAAWPLAGLLADAVAVLGGAR